MKRVLMLIVLIWLYFIIGLIQSSKTFAADAQVNMPTVDGLQTYAYIPMTGPGGNNLYLTAAYKTCPAGFHYGMLLNGAGEQIKWFCWKLNVRFGTIESTDQYSMTVEEFNWTDFGIKYLRKEVQL